MTRRRRIPIPLLGPTDAEIDEATERMISAGLGIRPAVWWEYVSERPDLAEDAHVDDLYGHVLSGVVPERAVERLRYLDSIGELRQSELIEIAAGRDDFGHRWRRGALRSAQPSPENDGRPV
jgi:hypothetical protein